jgi:hypothetical protein
MKVKKYSLSWLIRALRVRKFQVKRLGVVTFILKMQHISEHEIKRFGVYGFMVFNAIFNNISVTSWRSDLLMEETKVP